MAIAPSCPACNRTHAQYKLGLERGHHAPCPDPWHNYLTIDKEEIRRREEIAKLGRPRERAIDKAAVHTSAIQARAAFSRESFEHHLHQFVNRWGPVGNTLERDDFQRDLMMLMRDAMQHQGNVFGLHVERTDATMYNLVNASTAPLQAIFDPPKKET